MKTKLFLTNFLFCLTIISSYSQDRVGDPGVTFDQSIINNNQTCYPQMRRWSKAGVEGGIPFISSFNKTTTINPGNANSINNAINSMSNSLSGNQKGLIILKNGNYNINRSVNMKSNVSLRGESRDGVRCNITMTGGNSFSFQRVTYSGLYNMTIRGTWGQPKYNWNYGINANNELPNNDNISIKMTGGGNCWLDKVTIINCARDPLRINSRHNTLRDLYVDGAHKKAGGAQGYFFIQDGDNLITGCYVTRLRHISLQGGGVEFNVVYDNKFDQEVSFHTGDDGNNLIENNKITLPVDMPPVAQGDADATTPPEGRRNKPIYFAIMGPWAEMHQNSKKPNYLINNTCLQLNHNFGPMRPWSESGLVYKGPLRVGLEPSHHINNFPLAPVNCRKPNGGTLYPINVDSNNCTQGTPCNDNDPCTVNDVLDSNCNCVGEDSNQDSDNDGICDAVDECPDFDDNLIGQPCDDGDLCTFNDVYTANCLCEGVSNEVLEIEPTDDAYLQSGNLFNNTRLHLEQGNRVSYLKFDLRSINQNINKASLKLIVANDPGNGVINIYKSDDVNWTESNLTTANAPGMDELVGTYSGNYNTGDLYESNLSNTNLSNIFSLVLVHQGGNDVSFHSKDVTNSRPKIRIEVEGCNLSNIDIDKPFNFSMYPNPVKEILHFNIKTTIEASNFELDILDALGREIYSRVLPNKLNNGKIASSINVSQFHAGVYFIVITNDNLKEVRRIVINK